MKVVYTIGKVEFGFDLEGDVENGQEKVMLDEEVNILKHSSFNPEGYVVKPFLSSSQFEVVQKGVELLIKKELEAVLGQELNAFNLKEYHTLVDDEQHLALAARIKKGFPIKEFPIDGEIVENRVSTIVNKEVKSIAKHLQASKFYNDPSRSSDEYVQIFNVRIVRPQKYRDNNPPHKDVYIDHLKNAVNIYVPICGSTKQSALPLIAGSHLISESRITRTTAGALLNNTKFTVPCVVSLDNQNLQLQRPNPKENEVMVFSPYLIHGGGYNFQEDVTRVSLEMRFWQA